MPQIANQDYNVIDFNVLPYYEAVERLYRAYLQGTAFDCVVKQGKQVNKIIAYGELGEGDIVGIKFGANLVYFIKAPLAVDDGGYLICRTTPTSIFYIVSADGFKLKPVVQDRVLTGVEVTTEKVENDVYAQYFKDWMIGQPFTGGK